MLIAVTGASGFVGGHVVRRLLRDGHRVIAYGRRRSPSLPTDPNLEYLRWDITQKLAQPPTVDGVVHCAGSVTEWGTAAQFQAANVIGTANVLASFLGTAHFVHISTASVYDLLKAKRSIDENTPLASTFLGHYTRSKIEAEAAVHSVRTNAVLLRPHVVYGPGDTRFLPRILALRRRGGLVVPGDGRNQLSITHVDNLCDAILNALGRRHGIEIFNIADPVTATLNDLLSTLQIAFGLKPRILHVPFALAWPAAIANEGVHNILLRSHTPQLTRFLVAQLATEFTLDCRRAETHLGYRPRRSYSEAFMKLAETVAA